MPTAEIPNGTPRGTGHPEFTLESVKIVPSKQCVRKTRRVIVMLLLTHLKTHDAFCNVQKGLVHEA